MHLLQCFHSATFHLGERWSTELWYGGPTVDGSQKSGVSFQLRFTLFIRLSHDLPGVLYEVLIYIPSSIRCGGFLFRRILSETSTVGAHQNAGWHLKEPRKKLIDLQILRRFDDMAVKRGQGGHTPWKINGWFTSRNHPWKETKMILWTQPPGNYVPLVYSL